MKRHTLNLSLVKNFVKQFAFHFPLFHIDHGKETKKNNKSNCLKNSKPQQTYALIGFNNRQSHNILKYGHHMKTVDAFFPEVHFQK